MMAMMMMMMEEEEEDVGEDDATAEACMLLTKKGLQRWECRRGKDSEEKGKNLREISNHRY